MLDRYDLPTLEAALTRRRARDKELTAATKRRRELEAELAKISAAMGGGAVTGRSARTGPLVRKPNARRLNDITVGDAIEKVLGGLKAPQRYQEITSAIVKRRLYRTRSKSFATTVLITLGRDRRFKKTSAGWALRK
jgi:hypothetical protein